MDAGTGSESGEADSLTPPNAIIFGSGRSRIAQIARVGLVINLIGIVVISLLFYTLGTAVFSIDPTMLPEWAAPPSSG